MVINISKYTDIDIFIMRLENKIKKFPDGFWQKPNHLESSRDITIYLIENILKWSDEDIKSRLTEMTFRNYKLSGMLEYVFNRSPYLAINNAYPDHFKAWELKQTPKNFWNDETIIEFIKWTMQKESIVDIIDYSLNIFRKYNNGGAVRYIYNVANKDLYYYLNLIQPNKYIKEQFTAHVKKRVMK